MRRDSCKNINRNGSTALLCPHEDSKRCSDTEWNRLELYSSNCVVYSMELTYLRTKFPQATLKMLD